MLAVASMLAVPAHAQERAMQAGSDPVPTVTIINESPARSAAPAAKPLEVLPPASAGTPVAAPQTSPDAPSRPAHPSAAAAAPAPSSSTAQTPPEADAAEPPPPPPATLAIDIDLTRQVMTVSENGAPLHTWQISSARYGYRTPTGTYRPTWMAKMWYSRQYDLAPMPHSIFFHKGVAIHGTYATRALGNPASHGCVRLALANAATLYKLVSRHGKERTEIVVHGTPNHTTAGRVAAYGIGGAGEAVRVRRSSPYRYLPPSAFGRGPVVYNSGYSRRTYAPRGSGGGFAYGYGF